jgi:TonB family protein
MAIPVIVLAAAVAAANASKPVPIDPQSWFVNDDYPADAIRAEKQGKVGYRLDVDAAGAVTGCTIIASSGSALLDAPTCELLRKRARFQPARDRNGRAIASAWNSALKWVLPAPVESATTTDSGFAVTTYEAAPDGKLLSCRTVGEQGVRVGHDPCAGAAPSWIVKYAPSYRILRLQSGNGPVNMLPALPGPDWGQVISRRLDILSWATSGRLVACDVVASEGPPDVAAGVCSTNAILPKGPGDADQPVVKLAIGWAIYGVRR